MGLLRQKDAKCKAANCQKNVTSERQKKMKTREFDFSSRTLSDRTNDKSIFNIEPFYFFGIFTTFRKLVVIHLILAIKTQFVYQMKNDSDGHFLVESVYETIFEKVENSVIENTIFRRGLN